MFSGRSGEYLGIQDAHLCIVEHQQKVNECIHNARYNYRNYLQYTAEYQASGAYISELKICIKH